MERTSKSAKTEFDILKPVTDNSSSDGCLGNEYDPRAKDCQLCHDSTYCSILFQRTITKKVKEARISIARFINANENEIIFTRNTTEGINLLANSFDFKTGDVVLATDKEHNSNLVPWLYRKEKFGINVCQFSQIEI